MKKKAKQIRYLFGSSDTHGVYGATGMRHVFTFRSMQAAKKFAKINLQYLQVSGAIYIYKVALMGKVPLSAGYKIIPAKENP